MPGTMDIVNFPGTILYRKNAPGTARHPATAFLTRPELPEQVDISPVTAAKRAMPQAATIIVNKAPPKPSGYQQALALYRQGRYHEAAAQAETLLGSRQDRLQALHLLARVHANQGNLAKARQWCRQAIDSDRLDPVGHYLLAVVLLEQGLADDGKQELKRTLYLDPDFALAHFALGNLCRKQGSRKDARKHFDNALLSLAAQPPEELLPEAEGLTAGRLAEIIQTLRKQEESA